MNFEQHLNNQIKSYFEQAYDQYGPTPKGVDWNSEQAQEARFEQLLKIRGSSQEFSIIDYGCGYGALANTLGRKGFTFQYYGYDLLESFIARAQELHRDKPNCNFTALEADLPVCDFTIACGIFNKKFEASDEEWTGYILQNLEKMAALSRRGFSFNLLPNTRTRTHAARPVLRRPVLRSLQEAWPGECALRTIMIYTTSRSSSASCFIPDW
jgi:SAM-dependent methyltransferase